MLYYRLIKKKNMEVDPVRALNAAAHVLVASLEAEVVEGHIHDLVLDLALDLGLTAVDDRDPIQETDVIKISVIVEETAIRIRTTTIAVDVIPNEVDFRTGVVAGTITSITIVEDITIVRTTTDPIITTTIIKVVSTVN
jgi:hypothetical protein